MFILLGYIWACNTNHRTTIKLENKMKNTVAIISLLSVFLGLNLSAEQINNVNSYSSEALAERLIALYDLDETGALNELELSTAVDFLAIKIPSSIYSYPEIANKDEKPASPKVAVTMRRSFDLNADYQLCEDELAHAITGFRAISS